MIRGGYGFYWAPMQFSGVGETAMGRLGYTATTTYLSSTDGNRTPANSLSDPFPSGITTPQGNSLGLATGAGGVIDFVDQNSRPGQVQQYSIDYSREMHGGIAVSVGYSGSRSEHMPVGGTVDSTININQLDPQYLALGPALLDLVPNPFFGNAAFGNLSNSPTIARGQLLRPFPQFTDVLAHRVSEVRTQYDALTLRFDRRIRNNWGVNANYTFSRLMDNQFGESNTYAQRNNAALDNYDLDREWGYSLLDVPHRVNVNGTFVLPIGAGHRWMTDGRWQRPARWLVGQRRRAIPARISGQRLAVHEQLRTARQLAAPQHRARRRAGDQRNARRAADQLDQPRGIHPGAGLHLRQRAADAAGSAHARPAQRGSQRAEDACLRSAAKRSR